MDGNKSVTATFAINQYTLAVSTVGNGTVTKNPDQAIYDWSSLVQLTAVPTAGWHFVSWSGNLGGNFNPINVLMDANKNITATFAPDAYTLDVTVAGWGIVSKIPDLATYSYGTGVSLVANPLPGWHLASWSGDAIGSSSPLLLSMTGNKSITATFELTLYTLNVTVVGSGTVTKSPDAAGYTQGTTVTLEATPTVGWHFLSWSGGVTGTDNPVDVDMFSNKNVTATFAQDVYTLTVTIPGGHGTVTKSPTGNQSQYLYGQIVTLTATPALGYHLVGWTGDATGSVSPTTVLMDGDKSVTATFAINQYTFNVTIVGDGTVTKNPDQAIYDWSTLVQLTAVPAPGWHFTGWSGSLGGNFNPVNVLMDANKNITATFVQDEYFLTVDVVGNGVVDYPAPGTVFHYGDYASITALPLAGWSFSGWSGDASGTTNPLLLLMDGNKSVTATFAATLYTVNVTIVGSGTVAKIPDAPGYPFNYVVSLEATPADGWNFVSWSGNASGTEPGVDIIVNSNKNVTATFTDVQPPAVTLLSPTDADKLVEGSPTEIKWSVEDNAGAIKTVDLFLSRDGGQNYELIQSDVPNTGSFSWEVTAGSGGQAFFKVVAKDAGNNVGEGVSKAAVSIRELAMPLQMGIKRLDSAVKAFELGMIAPNPATGPMRMDFSVAKETQVRLEVLDVQGRQMATLANGTYPAGRYQAVWDGAGNGGRVPAGMYFVRYQAAGLKFTKRVVIAR